jgi:hypothetical protein
MNVQTDARIAKPGHPFDGCPVIISHAGINRHPNLDSAYGATAAQSRLARPVSVLILATGRPQELLDTVDAADLVVDPPAPTFVASDDVPCADCGGPTIPPYTDAAGRRFDGFYCEGCGWTTYVR